MKPKKNCDKVRILAFSVPGRPVALRDRDWKLLWSENRSAFRYQIRLRAVIIAAIRRQQWKLDSSAKIRLEIDFLCKPEYDLPNILGVAKNVAKAVKHILFNESLWNKVFRELEARIVPSDREELRVRLIEI